MTSQQSQSDGGSFLDGDEDGQSAISAPTTYALGARNGEAIQGVPPGQKLPEKHQFVMSRRRGTAGPLNPKQNVHADLLAAQAKLVSQHPHFVKTRQRSPLLPSTFTTSSPANAAGVT